MYLLDSFAIRLIRNEDKKIFEIINIYIHLISLSNTQRKITKYFSFNFYIEITKKKIENKNICLISITHNFPYHHSWNQLFINFSFNIIKFPNKMTSKTRNRNRKRKNYIYFIYKKSLYEYVDLVNASNFCIHPQCSIHRLNTKFWQSYILIPP